MTLNKHFRRKEGRKTTKIASEEKPEIPKENRIAMDNLR
jgi:hypothetical protein